MSKEPQTTIFLAALLLLTGCTQAFVPHPENQSEKEDFAKCLKLSSAFPDAAYLCHVAVEDREWMEWKGYQRKEWSK